MESKKKWYKWTYLENRYRLREWIYGHQGGRKDLGRDTWRVWDGPGHIAVFNMENQQGPVVQPGEVCSILDNNLMVTRGKGGGRDSQGVWDGHGHTAVFNMENPQGPAGQPRELCSVSRGSRDGRGVWRRMDTWIWMAECLCFPPKSIITLLMGYTPIRYKKLSQKKLLAPSLF